MVLCLLILAVSAPLIWLGRPDRIRFGGYLAAVPPAVVFGWLLAKGADVESGAFPVDRIDWASELGLDLRFRLDGLAHFFGLIISGIGAAIALYTHFYLDNDRRQGYFLALLYLFMASMLGLVWSDNLLTLFAFWEGTSITSYLMIGYHGHQTASQDAARRAFLVTGLGGLAMLAGFILLGQAADTFTISELLVMDDLVDHPHYPAALILILAGAFTKSAQFPFHFWLPGAMAAPTPASAYLHSATMVKAGVFLLARLHPALADSKLWFYSLLVFGGVTMLVGAISAFRYDDLKKVLAYATVSQLGVLVMLLAFEEKATYGAVVIGVLAHALYKGPLFMVAGIVDHSTGTRDIRSLAGLRTVLPVTTVIATLAGLSMAGFPPLFGFVAKESLLETTVELIEHGHPVVGTITTAAAAILGALFVGYSLRLVWEPFYRSTDALEPRVEADDSDGDGSDDGDDHHFHRPGPGFVLGPLLVVLAGTALPFVAPLIEDRYLSPAATSMAGEEIVLHPRLWHGFTPVLAVSAVAIAGGFLLFSARHRVAELVNRLPASYDATRVFDRLYRDSYRAARRTTDLLQGQTLGVHATIALLAMIGALAASLFSAGGLGELAVDVGRRPRVHETIIALLAIIAALATVRAPTRLNQIISIGVVGVTMTLIFIDFGAPDLALTQLVVDVLTVVLLVLVFYRIPPDQTPARQLRSQARNLTTSGLVAVFGAVVVLIVGANPYFNSISDYFKLNSVPGGHGGNVVNVILVDFRGIDTLGEIAVLAIAAVGGYALLRAGRYRPAAASSDDEGVSL